MDSMDDDCGELYGDVESQACSAIKAMYIEQENGSNDENLSAGEKILSAKDERDQDSDESDGEDELKIVVNDEDWENLPATVVRSNGGFGENEDGDCASAGTGLKRPDDLVVDGLEVDGNVHNGEGETFGAKRGFNSQYKAQFQYTRPLGSSYQSNMRINGAASSGSCSKGGSSGLFSDVYRTANSLLPQYRYLFSHPWYRNILNVDFDSLEEMPWRLAGADITDFFNFGLNEESWIQYCNSLEKYCQQASMPNTMIYDSSKVYQPHGRAIQVEESIGERQSSMDVWPPCFQDSDVVIQINLQDSISDPSGSIKVDRSQSTHEISKQEIMDAEDDVTFLVSRCSGVDDLSGSNREENNRVVASNASRRFLPHKTASDEKSSDTGTHANDKIIYEDGECQGKINVCTSEQTAEAMETIKAGKGLVLANTCESDPCLAAKESSLDNGGRLSFSTSCFESDSDSSSDGSVDDGSPKVQGPLRRPHDSGNEFELHDSRASDYKSSRRDGRKRTKDGEKPHSKYRSPVRNTQKHQSGESHVSAKRNITHRSVCDSLPMLDAKGEKNLCPRNVSPALKNEKKHYGRWCSFTRGKMYTKNCKNVSQISGGQGVDRSSFYSGRWKERSRDCDFNDREDSSHHTGKELNCYNGQGFAYNRVGHKKKFHVRTDHSFRGELGQRIHKNWNEMRYLNKRKGSIGITDSRDRIRQRESGGSFSGCTTNTLKGRNYHWRRGNTRLQVRKSADNYGCLLDHNDENEEMENTYGQAFSFTDHERDFSVEPYERCHPVIEREVKVYGRRGHNDDTVFHPNKSRYVETEDAYHRDLDSHYFYTKIDRECLMIDGERWHDTLSPRNKSHGSRLSQEYLRHCTEIVHDEYGESGWFGSYNDTGFTTEDEIMSDDDQIHPWGRSYSWQTKCLPLAEDELIVRRHDYRLPARDAFYIRETSNPDVDHAARGSLTICDDLQFGHARYILKRERNGVSRLNRNSFSNYQGDDEQMIQKCRGSVNLIVGEGKFTGRRTNGGSLTRNFWREKMQMEFPRNRRLQRNHQRGKSIKTNFLNAEAKWNDNEMLQKPLTLEHYEEGQITRPEGYGGKLGKKSRICFENASSRNKASNGYDNQRMLDTLARMEKRRERFKDLVAEEPEKADKVGIELIGTTSDIKLQRPTRKRRWCTS